MRSFLKTKAFYKKVMILAFCLWVMAGLSSVYAQCDPNIDPFCDDPDIPLDGGLAFLIAAGTLYGLKKIKDKKHQPE